MTEDKQAHILELERQYIVDTHFLEQEIRQLKRERSLLVAIAERIEAEGGHGHKVHAMIAAYRSAYPAKGEGENGE